MKACRVGLGWVELVHMIQFEAQLLIASTECNKQTEIPINTLSNENNAI